MTRKQALVSKPPSMRVLQVPVTAAFLNSLTSFVISGGGQLKDFVPLTLAESIGVSPITGKPLRAKEPKS